MLCSSQRNGAYNPSQLGFLGNSAHKYALFPVWLVNATWNGKSYTYAMNGQTGKFVGNIPTDEKKAKLTGGLIGLAAGLLAYGIAWLIELL